jgi:hypothetical protein
MDEKGLYWCGNALKDGKQGWFVGQFMPSSMGLSRQTAVEVKWGQHPKGERRRGVSRCQTATTISVLISGAFVTRLMIDQTMREITLATPGDYLVFGPGIAHSWEALEDSLVISVRFPSLASDLLELSADS